jgi:hypothetical protein
LCLTLLLFRFSIHRWGPPPADCWCVLGSLFSCLNVTIWPLRPLHVVSFLLGKRYCAKRLSGITRATNVNIWSSTFTRSQCLSEYRMQVKSVLCLILVLPCWAPF